MTSYDVEPISSEPVSEVPVKPTTRRRMLKLGGAGAAALVATMLPRNGARATHDPDGDNALHVGEENFASAQTVLVADITPPSEGPAEPPALRIENHTGTGIHAKGTESGLFGESDEFIGVSGKSDTGVGVGGESVRSTGVFGHSNAAFGVSGSSDGPLNDGGVGVGGFSAADLAVLGIGGEKGNIHAEGDGVGGFSFNSVGGRFVSFNGIGARAVSPGDAHPALQAASGQPTDPHAGALPDGGLALEVIGKARFSTAGKGTVPAGADSVEVTDVPVTPDSHITVTLSSNPGSRQLHWVERGNGGFTVHLTSAPPPQSPATDFTYLIVESPTQA